MAARLSVLPTSGKKSRISYLENVASRHIIVVQHVTLGEDLGVPAGEINLLLDVDTNESSILNGGALGLNLLGGGVDNLLGGLLAIKLLASVSTANWQVSYMLTSEKSTTVSLTPVFSR